MAISLRLQYSCLIQHPPPNPTRRSLIGRSSLLASPPSRLTWQSARKSGVIVANVTATDRDSNGKSSEKKKKIKKGKLEGVSEELNLLAAQSLDWAPTRRRVRTAFLEVQKNLDHVLFKMAPKDIQMEETYETNSKGVEIFWKSWLPPVGVSRKAALFFCHGYGDTCTFFFEGIAKQIAHAGYAVYAMDYPGFGLSYGLHGYIPSFDGMVDHVIEQYNRIKGRKELQGLRHFILGQSMGGAVALKVHLKRPADWDGVLLVAPMCKIAEDVTPPGPVLKGLSFLLLNAHSFPSTKYGKEFVMSALELRPDSCVNRTVIEKLSVKAPSAESKLNVLKSIAQERGLEWDSSATEAQFNKKYDDLLDSSESSQNKPTTICTPTEVRSIPTPVPVKQTAQTASSSVLPNQSMVQSTEGEKLQASRDPSDVLERAREAIALADNACNAARLAVNLASVKLSVNSS